MKKNAIPAAALILTGAVMLVCACWGALSGANLTAVLVPDWSIVTSPNNGSSSNYLNGVACASESDCWAVGEYDNSSTGSQQTLVEHWDGQFWSIVTSPNNGTLGSVLNSVACASGSECWAVGFYVHDNSNGQALIERWNGQSWSIVTPPNIDTPESHLWGVTCTSGSNCWAVGNYYNSSTLSRQTLIEHWNGASWSIIPSANNGPLESELSNVTCTSGSDCWAVGDSYNGGSFLETLVEHWNGTAWSIVSSPNNGSLANFLNGVACASGSDCWAVGHYYYNNSTSVDYQILIEHWDGTAWSVATPPNSGKLSDLLGVTCASESDCWAVGGYSNLISGSGGEILMEHWNGVSWSIVTPPSIGTYSNGLAGVTCASGSDCWAVGAYENSIEGIGSRTLTEHHITSSPTPTPTPTPPLFTPTPAPTPTPIPTKMDGSGTINALNGAQANFTIQAAMVKTKKGKAKINGTFSYSDPAAPLTFSANKITSATITGNHASFSGTAKTSRKHGKISFTVDVIDNGDPGTNDTFSISMSNGYSVSGNLTSGDILIH